MLYYWQLDPQEKNISEILIKMQNFSFGEISSVEMALGVGIGFELH